MLHLNPKLTDHGAKTINMSASLSQTAPRLGSNELFHLSAVITHCLMYLTKPQLQLCCIFILPKAEQAIPRASDEQSQMSEVKHPNSFIYVGLSHPQIAYNEWNCWFSGRYPFCTNSILQLFLHRVGLLFFLFEMEIHLYRTYICKSSSRAEYERVAALPSQLVC